MPRKYASNITRQTRTKNKLHKRSYGQTEGNKKLRPLSLKRALVQVSRYLGHLLLIKYSCAT